MRILDLHFYLKILTTLNKKIDCYLSIISIHDLYDNEMSFLKF